MSVKTLAAAVAATTLVVASAGALTVSAKGPGLAAQAAKPSDQTIVEIVKENDGKFDVLQAAVVKTGLVDALNGNKQLTVFAPTDQAFVDTFGVADEAAALATIASFDNDALADILLFHVTEGRRISTSVLAAPQYQMLNGDTLSRATLSDAGLGQLDISARNGLVHVINSVLIP